MELVSVGENLNTTAQDVLNLELDDQNDLTRTALNKQTRKDRWMIMMVTVGMFLAFRNCFVGFITGCIAWALLEVQSRMETWKSEDESSGETTPLLR
jgi:hypothetical protein